MKNEPLFNYKILNTTKRNGLVTGEKMQLGKLYEIRQPLENERVYSQMFTSKHEMCRENIDYNYWNGCVFEDIDYDLWIDYCIKNNSSYEEPQEIFKNVFTYLINNNNDMFYYGEYSRSGKGFHFIFAADITEDYIRTNERRDYLKLVSISIIRNAFIKCGYKSIIEFEIKNGDGYSKPKKVHDDCCESPFQICFLTGNGIINKNWNGEWGKWGEIVFVRDKLKVKKEITDINENAEFIKILIRTRNVSKAPYISHYARWSLFNSLSTIFKDDDLKNEWIKCARKIPEEHGHTTQYYEELPYKLDWNEKLDGNEYCDTSLLETFGYDVKIKEKKNTMAGKLEQLYNLINI